MSLYDHNGYHNGNTFAHRLMPLLNLIYTAASVVCEAELGDKFRKSRIVLAGGGNKASHAAYDWTKMSQFVASGSHSDCDRALGSFRYANHTNEARLRMVKRARTT